MCAGQACRRRQLFQDGIARRSTPAMPDRPRHFVAQRIALWLQTGKFPSRLMPADIPQRALVMEILYGVLRWQRRLEWVLARRIRHMPPAQLKAWLLVGLYQVLSMRELAPYAAVNETVAAVKKQFSQSEANFVNALLRGVLRDKAALTRALRQQALGVRVSHPDVLLERWQRVFGLPATRRLCVWNNSRPAVMLHVNRLKISPEDYLALLREHNIAVREPAQAGGCLALPRGLSVASLPGYKEGLFLVMDPAALAAVRQLQPQPGEEVLDACAAPGGKTFLLAAAMRAQGRLVAMDLHQDRLERLRQNLQRLDCADWVEVRAGDAGDLTRASGGLFDRILLDAPCSNTGVIRRRPEARWRFTEARLARLVRQQQALLERLSALLKPGGRLVYSTCSLEEEENAEVVAAFLRRHPEFRCLGQYKTFPPQARMDGAYVAVLQK